MGFFSLKDKFDDLRHSYTPGDKLLNGAKLLGTAVANTAIGAGKVGEAFAEAHVTAGERRLKK